MSQNPVVVAVTGASGSIYAIRLLQVLLDAGRPTHVIISGAARQVILRELGLQFPQGDSGTDVWSAFPSEALQSSIARRFGFAIPEVAGRKDASGHQGSIRVWGLNDYSAGIASGSFLTDGMVICPCSMGTLSAIASGASTNLIHRAADVHLKERRPLVLLPRETPLSLIQLENMTRVCQAGATVMPAMPGFYHQPQSIADLVDFIVGRMCDHLRIPHRLFQRWGETE
jgi:4-hydroxy-3-polyprenylbenzoate decarboxylase